MKKRKLNRWYYTCIITETCPRCGKKFEAQYQPAFDPICPKCTTREERMQKLKKLNEKW